MLHCAHVLCTHVDGIYQDRRSLLQHEKKKKLHPCDSSCKRCNELVGKMVGEAKAGHPCTHLICGRTFAHLRNRSTHELHDVHNCDESCKRCEKASLKRKLEIEKKQHDNERCSNKKCREEYVLPGDSTHLGNSLIKLGNKILSKEDVNPEADWEKRLKDPEDSFSTSCFLVTIPKDNKSEPTVIPYAVLEER
jgi:hypothetical protein